MASLFRTLTKSNPRIFHSDATTIKKTSGPKVTVVLDGKTYLIDRQYVSNAIMGALTSGRKLRVHL